MINRIIVMITMLVFLSGCATMFSKNQYRVPVVSTPPAYVTIVDKRTGIFIMARKTPFMADLSSRYSSWKAAKYIVSAKVDGYIPQKKVLRATMSRWVIGDILIEPMSFICLDMYTGRIWNLDTGVDFKLIKK
jgi:hypothetical protein